MNWRYLPLYKWLSKTIESSEKKEVMDRGGSITNSEVFHSFVEKTTKGAYVIWSIVVLVLAFAIIRGWFI